MRDVQETILEVSGAVARASDFAADRGSSSADIAIALALSFCATCQQYGILEAEARAAIDSMWALALRADKRSIQ